MRAGGIGPVGEGNVLSGVAGGTARRSASAAVDGGGAELLGVELVGTELVGVGRIMMGPRRTPAAAALFPSPHRGAGPVTARPRRSSRR